MNIKDAAQHLHNATKRIRELEQQRAELLEALKEMWDAHEHNTSGRLSVMVIEAITRAEADLSGETNAL